MRFGEFFPEQNGIFSVVQSDIIVTKKIKKAFNYNLSLKQL